jgi:hypothetical protein
MIRASPPHRGARRRSVIALLVASIVASGCVRQPANRRSTPYATSMGGVEGWLNAPSGERIGVEARLSNGGSWVLIHRPAERCGTGWIRVATELGASDYFHRPGASDVVPRMLDAGTDAKVIQMYRGTHAVVVPRIAQLAVGMDCGTEILSAGLTRVGQFFCWTLPSK